MIVRHVEATVTGRFLHEDRGAERLLVGFHGFGEGAEANLRQIEKIAGIERWSVMAIQALHPFYTRSGEIVASWMTSLDREAAIASNIRYVRACIESVPHQKLVLLGFSQGAAMAARAAAYAARADGLILLGGDIPPEIHADPAIRLPPVLLARGSADEWYTDEKFKKDLSFLEGRTPPTRYEFEGGHEWTDGFREVAAEFLRAID